MSGRGLKARATQVCGGCQVAGYRPALPGAAVDVRSRAKSPRYKARAIQGRATQGRTTRDQKLVVLIRLSAGASAAMTRNDKPHQKFGLLIKLDQRHL